MVFVKLQRPPPEMPIFRPTRVIVLQQQHAPPAPAGFRGAHQPGGAAADHHHLESPRRHAHGAGRSSRCGKRSGAHGFFANPPASISATVARQAAHSRATSSPRCSGPYGSRLLTPSRKSRTAGRSRFPSFGCVGPEVLLPQMHVGPGDLDQPLVEERIRIAAAEPEMLQHVVRFVVIAGIETGEVPRVLRRPAPAARPEAGYEAC